MRHRWASALVLAAAASGAALAEDHIVRIEGMQFVPATVTVHRGDRVVWQNQDMVPHTATAVGRFDTGVIAQGRGVSRVMDKAGSFAYACTLHPGMKGEVVVQ